MIGTIKLGLGQMLVVGGDAAGNLARGEQMIREAAKQGCQVVVLPECMDLGWAHPAAQDLAQPIPGAASDRLCRAAHEQRIYVVAGITERDENRLYNAAVLIAPDGRILLKHRKINLLVDVEGIYAVGDSLSVARTPLGTFGIDICADNFPSSLALGHSLARMGAGILLSPSAWAVEAEHDNRLEPYGELWRTAYSTLACLYDIPVIGVSSVGRIDAGPWQGRKCIGCSLAVGPGGTILAQGPYGEAAESLVVVGVEMTPRTVTGTAIAEMLAGKGYRGP